MTESKAKTLQGVVVSVAMDKTVVVEIERRVKHEFYEKIITRSNKLHVHDHDNVCAKGDRVKIASIKPMSKKKTWALLEVLEKAR